MKYILLVHHNEQNFRALSESVRADLLSESVQLANDLHKSGKYFDAAPLHSTEETMSVRVREGKALVTDGPFAETREQLAGYFLIEAANWKEAVEIAAKIPGARLGFVEVRPVRKVEGLPGESLLSSNPQS